MFSILVRSAKPPPDTWARDWERYRPDRSETCLTKAGSMVINEANADALRKPTASDLPFVMARKSPLALMQ